MADERLADRLRIRPRSNNALLESAGLSLDTVMAHGLGLEMDQIERIEAMVANAEKRRSEALRQIEHYRASFARKLREATESDAGAPQTAQEQDAL
jgi:hypothetical protein